ncbi:hypothetical protein CC85DRAFT_328437 [Cutaneotrichosporon oleaginosum]|uniref:Uncharacterized protein n=1 Tax=Cutaneotrichosporon oleaginosum TaxID=879819 RepID=A0A0J0XM64_9TREE|nr:uncharacterized protein CC85DRAFT_328437 [Cutaneotrichosporon oleaginosum]KLT42211.1 hypothetical protein CC85DRAFT_328437 [Cutaneotrichosporon oleaginosum]TXT11670.1 hypothetical protein COLE_02080 [Cutaneotrichosporon oleaginosum]
MYPTTLPLRPRPPGARRASLRATAGEASPLPAKHPLDMHQESPVPSKGKGYDMYTSPVQRPGMRRRPLSLLSESSVLSPPPPYGGGRDVAPSPEDKASPIGIPPPPPECLESGPSSVRNSLFDNEGPGLDEDDGQPGNTLTLRGVQKLIRQHEFETMSDTLQGRLLELTSSPNATLPSHFDLDADTSPIASPYRVSPQGRRLRSVPSDPGLAFSRPRSRVATNTGARDLRLAAVRAEEDAATIAQLEAALVEARESEESQRKAAARLRRDLSRMQRNLEHAEGVITDHQRYHPYDDDRDRLRSVERVTQWASLSTSGLRARGSHGPPLDDDPVVWGATAFPEFPRYGDTASETETETETETAVAPDRASAVPTISAASDAPLQTEPVAPQEASSANSTSSNESSEPPASPIVVLERAARPRPFITASTFASPARDGAAAPQVTINPASVSSSAYGAPLSTGPRRSRSVRATGTGSTLLRESMRVRTKSFTSGSQHLSNPGHDLKASDAPPSPSTASHTSELSVIDSVRSMFSAVVGPHCSLGSELGSGFHPTPTKSSHDMGTSPTQANAPVPLTPINKGRRPGHARYSSSPTTMFHFRGTLESPSQRSGYDNVYPGAPIRMGPVAANWSPESWPTPCPPPRDSMSEVDLAETRQIPQLITPEPRHRGRGWPSQPGAGPSLTPSPHYTTGLAPCTDPWDEYSDRLTPSPRVRNLRPLLLLARPSAHARTSSSALARDRSANRAGFRFSRVPPQPVPEPTPSNAVVAYTRNGGRIVVSPVVALVPRIRLPVTIPGRITHDMFCLILILLDYLEWFIILLYRFTVDLRAGPAGAETALGFKPREHPPRFYL